MNLFDVNKVSDCLGVRYRRRVTNVPEGRFESLSSPVVQVVG